MSQILCAFEILILDIPGVVDQLSDKVCYLQSALYTGCSKMHYIEQDAPKYGPQARSGTRANSSPLCKELTVPWGSL